jgi:hypothetical protein
MPSMTGAPAQTAPPPPSPVQPAPPVRNNSGTPGQPVMQ